jgi:hypothetical protein
MGCEIEFGGARELQTTSDTINALSPKSFRFNSRRISVLLRDANVPKAPHCKTSSNLSWLSRDGTLWKNDVCGKPLL